MDFTALRSAFAALAVAAFVVAAAAHAPAGEVNQAQAETRIAGLIAQLGAEDFGAREKAQSELSQLGLAAFDALQAAQTHHDPEIALRARYLVRSMSVRWFSDTDSPEAVKILRGYGEQLEPERRNRLDRLAALDDRQGIEPLCRLSRFETVDSLAKHAALRVMEATPAGGEAEARLAASINEIVGNSKRPAALWLTLHAQTLAAPASALAEWSEAAEAEHARLKKSQEQTSPEIVRDLYRYQVELLTRLKRDDEAIAVIRRTFDLPSADSIDQIQEVIDWLLHRQAWPVVVEAAEKFEPQVQQTPLLLYRLAAAYEKLGQAEKANEAAKKALLTRPENIDEHFRAGDLLEQMPGLVKFAEAEYRSVIEQAPAASVAEFKARFRLAELLHDRLEELAAAEMIKPACDLMQKDEAAKELCLKALRLPAGVFARMHYLFACHYHERQDAAKEKQHLESAIEADPTDADVLIAMYRFPQADDAWKAATKAKINEAAQQFRVRIDGLRATVETAGGEQSDTLSDLAVASNLYAWLVGNTFGDYADATRWSQEAVAISQRVLDLKPHYPGFLDTLARCYFAQGDLLNAVKHQSLAVKLNPDSGQLRRQLTLFQEEAKKRGVTLPKAEGTEP